MCYLENIEKHADFKKMSKSELAALGRERAKLQRNLLGKMFKESAPGFKLTSDANLNGGASNISSGMNMVHVNVRSWLGSAIIIKLPRGQMCK